MRKIVFHGDSVTFGVRTGVTQAETFAQKVGTARGFTETFNTGVPGDTTTGGLARFAADVVSKAPDAVCIMFGINDRWAVKAASASVQAQDVVTYDANIRSMVAQAKAAGASVTLLSPNPIMDTAWLVGIWPYVNSLMNIAADEGVVFVDVFSRFWAQFGIVPARANYDALFVDTQHPGPLGHQLITDTILHPLNAGACAVPPLTPLQLAKQARSGVIEGAFDDAVAAAEANRVAKLSAIDAATTVEELETITW
ncbi:hypothetical protein A7P25_19010 [Achromobacter xylosoxidans]|nr:hypothetical protein A7P25_19010 [Achromobacter xylosoxidans]